MNGGRHAEALCESEVGGHAEALCEADAAAQSPAGGGPEDRLPRGVGHILTQPDKSQYRAVLGRSDRRARWGAGGTRRGAFTKAMKFIDGALVAACLLCLSPIAVPR
eukprot:9068157-Pyramimonas_sp.AAC.1